MAFLVLLPAAAPAWLVPFYHILKIIFAKPQRHFVFLVDTG
jgi:hypothetical protein